MQLAVSTLARPVSAMPPIAAAAVVSSLNGAHGRTSSTLLHTPGHLSGFIRTRSLCSLSSSRCCALQEHSQGVGNSPSSVTATATATSVVYQGGHIEVVIGPMFAGKSSELLRRVAGYESQGLKVAIIKSNKDNRYSESHVVTHDGVSKACFAVPSLAAFREAIGEGYADIHVLAIDEAQFFSDLLKFCIAAADEDGKRIILSGLDGDFQRQKFGQILDLIPHADSVTKLSAVCAICQQEAEAAAGAAAGAGNNNNINGKQHGGSSDGTSPAVFSLRISGDSGQEVVGGADKYAPVCRRHYVELTLNSEKDEI